MSKASISSCSAMCRSSRVISGAAQLSRRHAWENDGTLIFLTEGHTRSTGQPPLRFWGLPCVKRGLAAFAGSGGEAARLFLQPWPRPQIRWSIAAAVLVCPFQQPARVHGIYSPAFGTVARPPRRPLLVKTSTYVGQASSSVATTWQSAIHEASRSQIASDPTRELRSVLRPNRLPRGYQGEDAILVTSR
jgi:hypothetical protein